MVHAECPIRSNQNWTSSSGRPATVAGVTRHNGKRELYDLLKTVTDLDLRTACVGALRAWRKAHPGVTNYSDPVEAPCHDRFRVREDFGVGVVTLLAAQRQPKKAEIEAMAEPFGDHLNHVWMTGVAEFLWWFMDAGLGVEVKGYPPGEPGYPTEIRLTRAGVRFLEATDDHPLLPGYLDRLASRCPGLPDDVKVLLLDARACLDRLLLRPAIALMGVALEAAIEAVAETLVLRSHLAPAVMEQSAARRIASLRAVVDQVMPGTKSQDRDNRFAAIRALEYCDLLRRRRNDAAHTRPTFDFTDREEAEEYFVSAARHLPNLWRLVA